MTNDQRPNLENLQNIDITLLRFIQQNRIECLDQFLYGISYFATYINIAIILTVLFISLYKKSKPLRVIFFKLVVVFIVAATVSFIIKNVVSRDRPFNTYPDIVKLSQAGSSSFPSGHTLEVFALATAFSIAFPRKKFVIPVFIWACMVAYTRMALGVHYPSDVIAGIFIGAFIGWTMPLIFKHGGMGAWRRGNGETGRRG